MRSADDLWPSAERGRVRVGPYATNPGSMTGAYFVACPATGRTLRIIASTGEDWSAAGLPGEPWEHVSVSVADRPKHTPSWPEMAWVKDLFWRPDEAVMQVHPPLADYVNNHEGCLHLWRPTASPIPLPPKLCV